MKAIIAGTFDPITVGHEALIKRASLIFDEVVVLVCVNFDKTTLFSHEERFELVKEAVSDIKNTKAELYEGWLYEYLKKCTNAVLFKGVRDARDLEYERKMAEFNFEHSGVETIFAFSDKNTENISSTQLRSLMSSGGEWLHLIPQNAQKLAKKIYKNN